MAEKNNAVCSICGKPYRMCLSCKDAIKLSPWKMHTDTSEHYKIFQIIKGYNTNVYTKEEAKYKLLNVDLEDLDTFKPNIKSIIEDILTTKNKETVEVLEMVKVEKTPIDEVKNTKETPIVFQKKDYKKNKYKYKH